MEVAQARAAMKVTNRRSHAGFSLAELLMVVTIIAILLAVSIPGVVRYIRAFKLQGALSSVTGQLQAARNRAVMKNVNLGVVWAPTADQVSGWAVEDDLTPQTDPKWSSSADVSWDDLLADKVQTQGTRKLDNTVLFEDPAQCGAGGAGNRWGIRFNRLGGACALPNANCGPDPANPPNNDNFIYADAAGNMTICLRSTNGLKRSINIRPGGRIVVETGFK